MTQRQPKNPPSLANWFKALGNPVRLTILQAIHDRGTASPVQLAELLKTTSNNTSYHVRKLESASLVEESHRQGKRGATEHFFRARLRASIGGVDCYSLPTAVRQGFILKSADAFIRHLIAAIEQGTADRDPDIVLRWLPITVLDDDGQRKVAAILRGAQSEIEKLDSRAIGTLARNDGDGTGSTPLIVGFAAFRAARLLGSPKPT